MILFCGIQASGKSSFYKHYFFTTHLHISLDLLKTRNRENRFLELCLETEQSCVIDNTNPTRKERTFYIEKAKKKKNCTVIGYYFQSKIEEALFRNSERSGKARIPDIGIKSTYVQLQLPTYDEGFDKLFYVELKNNHFIIHDWKP